VVLLDRDTELAALAAEVTEARSGSGRLVVVEGPAGIGKTSLLAAVGEAARAQGMTVLRAQAGPLEQGFSFGVARQLYAPLQSSPAWAELTVGAAALASRALGDAVPEPAGGEDAVHAAAHGLVWLTANLAERAPAVLVVDDVHWADAPSLRWLTQLARTLDELPLAVLAAVRTGEPPGHPELLAELLATSALPPVRPRPLGSAATHALVRDRLPAATPAFVQACHAACGGNPFLLGALLGELDAEDVAPTDEAADRLSAFGPDQVVRTVERQLAHLPEGAGDLAHALAVLDTPVPLRHAASVAELETGRAAELADALRAAGLLAPGDRLALAHPIVSAALYQQLPRGERARRHARAAELLLGDDTDPERGALHLLRTEPAADPATVAALRAAAARASARGAPETASDYLRRALDEPPTERAVHAAVLLELGLALAATLQPGATELFRRSVELADDPVARAEAAVRGARAVALASGLDDARAIAAAGLADVDAVPDETVARLEAEFMAAGIPLPEAQDEIRARLRRPLAPRSASELWRVVAAGEATFAGRPAPESLALLEPVFADGALAREQGSVLHTIAGCTLVWNEALDTAAALCDAVIDAARPRGWVTAVAHASYIRAMARLEAGAVQEAAEDGRFALDFKLTTLREPAALLFTASPVVDALLGQGAIDDADRMLTALPVAEPFPELLPSPILLQSRARLRHAQGRAEEALGDLREAARRWEAFGIRHAGLADWRAGAAAVLVELGEAGEARRLSAEQLALAEPLGCPGALAASLHAHALTAPRNERIVLLERAVAVTDGSQARLEHARSLLELGAALRRAGRRTECRAPLRRALDLASRGGAVVLARRADAELRTAGARPRRAMLTGPEALTGAEQRVATLAAQGHTNRQIAQELFVSRRTVETHLAHAFQKLGISGRDQLEAQLTA
jgi:DNA-binding CsgD family transcriptional regulator